jgi:predicted dehydrogenase/nucleoside-diphosphate-sugar epimerase
LSVDEQIFEASTPPGDLRERAARKAGRVPPAPGGGAEIPTTIGVRRLCLVGAGNIATVHAEALRGLTEARIAAVVDPRLAMAERLASATPGARAYGSLGAALAVGGFDTAHVLVPPDAHHAAALPLLEAGFSTLVEKPLAASGAQCDALIAAAARSGATLGVNQNFVFHPAFQRLRRELEAGLFGPLRFVDCLYNMPLRQLAARQFSHWMFHTPGNILLEQAVHPLSQIMALSGPVEQVRAIAGPPAQIAQGVSFFSSVTATLDCRAAPAQLRFAVGQAFPFWQVTAVCDDGVIVADILSNRTFAHARTRWLEPVDLLLSGARTAGGLLRATLRNAYDYGLSTARLKPRSDGFFQSMQGSIGAFYAALDAGARPELDGAFGRNVVAACDAIAAEAFGSDAGRAPAPACSRPMSPAPAGEVKSMPDVAVLGGTGFIGVETVRRLLAENLRVAVMARSVRNLPEVFADSRVALHCGDIADGEAVRRAIAGVRVVVNLAHGGGGGDYRQVKAAMVGGAANIARACLDAGVQRLVHISSIAALYLGPQRRAVTGKTPPDRRPQARADYARAKGECERMLLQLHAEEGLPVCILRPGLVVGAGTSPFHGGLGFFNNEQHCVGWNLGANRLPFVLVEDVAEAVLLAVRSEAALEGRCYNLVGDVQPTAREYVARLAQATGRPLRFHPSVPGVLWAQELAKWGVKCAGGHFPKPPSRRDILSRGLTARFDVGEVKRDLGWTPVADSAVFARLALQAHAR